jgi:AAA family ATP:ADP antiporter
VLLFTNLFVIIAALYHLKPASRSIFMNALSANQAYFWIAAVASLGLMISACRHIVARHAQASPATNSPSVSASL